MKYFRNKDTDYRIKRIVDFGCSRMWEEGCGIHSGTYFQLPSSIFLPLTIKFLKFIGIKFNMVHKIFLLIIISILMTVPVDQSTEEDYREKRFQMVKEQIENRGIHNKTVLKAMRDVPRHLFIAERNRYRAYMNSPVPIGMGQTISQPYIVAFMTQAINPEPGQKVLDVGTGSGYQAAILAEIVDSVYSIEILPQLGRRSAKLLDSLGYSNVIVKIGDGFHGWNEHAPYDAIIVAAAPNYIPEPLKVQLKEGGKMIIPVGPPHDVQKLMILTKKEGKIRSKTLLPVRFVPFRRK